MMRKIARPSSSTRFQQQRFVHKHSTPSASKVTTNVTRTLHTGVKNSSQNHRTTPFINIHHANFALKSFKNAVRFATATVKTLPHNSTFYHPNQTQKEAEPKEQHKETPELREKKAVEDKSALPHKKWRKKFAFSGMGEADVLQPTGKQECVAHATAKSYNLEALNEHFKKNNIEFKYNEPADVTWRRCGTGNVYYFRQGSIVCWGCTPQEAELLAELKPFEQEPLSEIETDKMEFEYAASTRLVESNISIVRDKRDTLTHMLAFSYGIQNSVQLEVLEKKVEEVTTHIGHISGSKSWVRTVFQQKEYRNLLKQLSEIVRLGSEINLHNNFTSTPDVFWENSEGETLFKAILKAMDINTRVEEVKTRLEYSQHQLTILKEDFHAGRALGIEILIVLLISVEVVLGLLEIML